MTSAASIRKPLKTQNKAEVLHKSLIGFVHWFCSSSFYDKTAVDSSSLSMLHCFLIRRAVVPSSGYLRAWELGDDDALGLPPLQCLMSPIGRKDFYWDSLKSRGDLSPVVFELVTVDCLFAVAQFCAGKYCLAVIRDTRKLALYGPS